jgi:O-antigen/teichoic acid export membrane protein
MESRLPGQNAGKTRGKLQGESVTRGLLLLGIGQGFFIVGGYVFHIYLARTLGPADYGLFGFVFTVLVWLEIFTYGMRDAVIQYTNTSPHYFPSLHSSFFIVQIYISCGIFILANLAFAPLALLKTRYDALFLIALLDLPLMGLYQLYLGYLNGFRLYSRQAMGLIVYAVTKAVFIILFVWIGWGVAGALFGNIFSSIFAFITCFILFWPKRKSELAATAGESLGLGQGGIATSTGGIIKISFLFIIIPLFYNLMMSMDLWIVSLAIGGDAVGFYVAAGTIAKTIFFLFAAFYMTLFPAIVAALRKEDHFRSSRLFYLSFALFFFIAFPATLLLAVNAKEITLLVYGSAYTTASDIISILSFAYFFLTLNVFLVYMLYAGGRRKKAAMMLAGITLMSLPLIYIFTIWTGIRGAAFATAFACLCGALLSYLSIRKTLYLGWRAKNVAWSVALALFAFLPLALIPRNQINFIPLSLLSTLIFFLGLNKTGLLPQGSFKEFYDEIKGNLFR